MEGEEREKEGGRKKGREGERERERERESIINRLDKVVHKHVVLLKASQASYVATKGTNMHDCYRVTLQSDWLQHILC